MLACVDASLVLKLLTWEDGSDRAVAWLRLWADAEIISPPLLCVEVASVLRKKMWRGELPIDHCTEALRLLHDLRIRYIWDEQLLIRAFDMAVELGQPTVYDTVYLALAEQQKCDLWTADTRFFEVASGKYPYVRCLD